MRAVAGRWARAASRRRATASLTPRPWGISAHGGAWSGTNAAEGVLQLLPHRSFHSKFPSTDETALLAEEDELADDRAAPKLVCGSCNNPLSRTRDLVFFKWRNGIHLSSSTDAPLERLRSKETWEGESAKWKKHRLHCLKCGHQVGTLARVFASDKILFSANRVSIQMPENQSPIVSLSGYPSSLLGFSMWTELILMAESQPALKEALQIRRVDNIRDRGLDRKQMNRRLLMAKDLRELLRIVDENSLELNDVNIRTALDRAARFVSTRSTRTSLVSMDPVNLMSPSEAPEDQLLLTTLPAETIPFPGSPETNAMDRERLWKLIDLAENLVNFSVSSFKRGYDLSSVANSLVRLGVGRETILRPIAKQMKFMVDAEEPPINPNDASLIATATVYLLPKDRRSEPWVKEMLANAKKVVLAGVKSSEGCSLEIIWPLVRSFAAVEVFDPELFATLFDAVNSGALDKEDLSPARLDALKARIYQVHLDCVLQKRPRQFRLERKVAAECKVMFQQREAASKSMSYRLHHLISSALEQMGVIHQAELGLEEGYRMDIALPKHQIGIEVNPSRAYQAANNELGVDSERPFMYVDLKARHLEQLGWIVIQLHAEMFQDLPTVEDRVAYLSMLLEVALQRRRDESVRRQQQ